MYSVIMVYIQLL